MTSEPGIPAAPSSPDAAAEESVGNWIHRLATSADGVYGLIIVAGMIVVSRELTASSVNALVSVVATLVVFYAAHVYSAAVSWLASGPGHRTLGQAVRHGIRESSGMVLVAIVPVAILLLGTIGVLDDSNAVWIALGVDVTLLGLLGWFIAAARTTSVWGRLSSMLVTAAFGAVLIGLKALVHH